MLVAGQQVSGFPIQSVVGYTLLETERADLGGLIGKEKVAQQTHFQSWQLDGRAIWSRFGLEGEVAFVRVLEDGKKVEVLKWSPEAMQGHLIEGFFTDEKEVTEKGIVCLLGE